MFVGFSPLSRLIDGTYSRRMHLGEAGRTQTRVGRRCRTISKRTCTDDHCAMSMPSRRRRRRLNSLLEAELNSVFRFMGEGSPYLSRATADVRAPLQEMVAASSAASHELDGPDRITRRRARAAAGCGRKSSTSRSCR